MAAFSCEGIPEHGLLLVPPSHAGFAGLVEQIRAHSPRPLPERLEFAAVLENHSPQSVVSLALEWRFEEVRGHQYHHRENLLFGRSLLLPFGARAADLVTAAYWQTILPGSRRLMTDEGIFGGNGDVRLPAAEELPGTSFSMGASGRNPHEPDILRHVHLAIDGAFFADGEFTGPNRMQSWEAIYYEAEVKLEAARVARAAVHRGGRPVDALAAARRYCGAQAEATAGPPWLSRESVSPEEFRRWHRSQLASWLVRLGRLKGDDAMVAMLLLWLEAPVPAMRRSL